MRKIILNLLILVGFVFSASAQDRTVSGRITSDKGNPIPNASVTVKGSQVGTTTGPDGSYSLTINAAAKQLEISSIGFVTQTINIRNSNSYSVVLVSTDGQGLEEVVITGINRIKKSQFTGAASKISSKELENRPVGSFDQLLQGRVPGLLALTGSGQPGTNSTVIIRGSNSIGGSNNPLYIVDGIQVEANTFQGLNPNDFASIDILRDASTLALYGSRGSAGVIVVTTKKGTPGKVKVSYGAQLGIKSTPDFAFRPMNTTELLFAQHEYGRIVGGNGTPATPGWWFSKDNPRYAGLTAADKTAADRALDSIGGINTRWYDEYFRPGTFSNHEVTLSGGTGKTRFFSSIGLYNEEGTINPSDMKRATLRNNIDFADDKFSYSLTSTFGYVKRNFDPAFPGYIFNSFLTPNIAAPYSKPYNADGSLLLTGAGGNAPNFGSQFLDVKRKDKVYNDQVKASLGVDIAYKVTKNITARVNAGVDFRETQNSTYNNRLAYVRTPASGQTSLTQLAGAQTESLTRFLTATVRPSINYLKTFADKHDVELTAVGEYVQENSKGIGFTGFGIDPRTPNTSGVITPGNAGNQLYIQAPRASNLRSQVGLASGLGMVRYTFNKKYTISGSYRSDGSSYLPENNRWTDFYSVGANWDMSKEKFLENSRVVNALRLRVSYGSAGNANNFTINQYQATYQNGTYSGLPTQVVNYVGNPDLKWEPSFTLNSGVDFELFNRRVYGDLNWYDKRTKDLLLLQRLPFETAGGVNILVNAGELQNTGFEWNINAEIVRTKDIVWTVFATGSYNKNKLLDLGGIEPYESGTSFLKVGLPIGSHYEVKWGGVDAATGQPLYYDLDGNLTNVYAASNSVTDFGTWESPWKGGFGTNVSFKGFDLSTLFSWQQGGNKVDNLEYFVENPVGFLAGGYNQSSDLNFWKQPGDVASTPSPLYGPNFSSKIIHDASFIRFRDLTIGYTLPAQALAKTKIISRARFYVQGTNLFMWTKWRGLDPEAGAVNLNLSEFPNPRAFTFGVNLTF
ncbi:MAG: SusC/RagA family TonB-linked outer membrane protein [Rhizobacter sp.]|nr:SusC/RagA family TonB-linked outer membrane protein [Ferruginibacter sp.]